MKALRRMWRRLAGSLAGQCREAELADEFEVHIEMAMEENLRRGMPPAEARRAALLAFGGVEAAKERFRDQRGLPWLETLKRDVRYAFRGMRRSPGFTAAAVICLALGIGANTAVFSVLNAVMIRSLPVQEPERLVLLSYESKSYPQAVLDRTSGMGNFSLPYFAYDTIRRRTQTLSGIFAFAQMGFSDDSLTVAVAGRPTVAEGEMVSGNYFSVLGVAPLLGRLVVEDDLKPGAPNVAVLSYRYWSREFGGEPFAIGRTIALNGQSFTIVGVTPPEFFGVNAAFAPDIWVPLRDMAALKPWGVRSSSRVSMFEDRRWWWCMMMGRLKSGVSERQALAELNILFQQIITEGLQRTPSPEDLPHLALSPAGRGLENLRKTFSKPLQVLTAAVFMLLLIACVNVATLLLARTNARQREMNIRLAIGASRGRLVRQLLTESVLLSACGGLLGIVIALWGSRALLRSISGQNPASALDVRPDLNVLAFTAVVSIMTGLLCGLAPVLRGMLAAVNPYLKESAASSTPRQTLNKALITAQVAFSVVLLFGAGLFVRTLHNLLGQDLGFNRENLLMFEIDPRRAGYEPGRVLSTYGLALEEIRGLPGVQSATVSRYALLSGWANNSPLSTDSANSPPPVPRRPNGIDWNVVGPDFFATMRIPVLLGRGISNVDVTGSRRVAVISKDLAHKYFESGNPLGHRLSFGTRYNPEESFEIVGVVEDTKWGRLREAGQPTAYVPYSVDPARVGPMYFVVRTFGEPLRMAPAMREAMFRIDPNLPIFNIKTQRGQIDESLTQERMLAEICTLFGVLALLLVAVGLYGTLAYAVTRRTSEIGIRVALGASRRQVLWMILRQGLVVIACGLAAGLPVALALSRVVASLLFDVKTYDTWTILVTLTLLTLVGTAAGALPASRASRIEPIQALHCE